MNLRSTDVGVGNDVCICGHHSPGLFLNFRVAKCLTGVFVAGLASFWTGIMFAQTMAAGSTIQAPVAIGSETLQTTQLNTVTQGNSTSSLVTQIQAYQNGQRSLIADRQALIARGATRQELQAWLKENAFRIQDLRQRAKIISESSALKLRETTWQAIIPANAFQTLKDYLTMQAALGNARAMIHNHLVGSVPSSPGTTAIGQKRQGEAGLFQRLHATDMLLQRQRVQKLAAEAAIKPIQIPDEIPISSNITPAVKALLTTKAQLVQGYVQLRNRYLNADPAARQAAIRQWWAQNAGKLDLIRQSTRQLSAPGTID